MMLPLGAIAQAVGPMNVSVPAFDDAGLAERQQQLAVRAELEQLEARGPVVAALSWNGPLSPAQKLPSRSWQKPCACTNMPSPKRLIDCCRTASMCRIGGSDR